LTEAKEDTHKGIKPKKEAVIFGLKVETKEDTKTRQSTGLEK